MFFGSDIVTILRTKSVNVWPAKTAGETRGDTGALGGRSGNDVVDRDETSWTVTG
jgi:hypothetical protein